jgi:FlaA1/EpsC-like NDP-sugar epimerase
MIHLSGLQENNEDNPNGDISIVFTGLRPGEKLYEELLIGDNVSSTPHPRIMRANEQSLGWEDLQALLSKFRLACEQENSDDIRRLLLEAVDGFKPQCGNQDLLLPPSTTDDQPRNSPHPSSSFTAMAGEVEAVPSV